MIYVLIMVLIIQIISFVWLNFYVLMNALLIIQQFLIPKFIFAVSLIIISLIYYFKFRFQKFININYIWISFSLFFIYIFGILIHLIYIRIWKFKHRIILSDWINIEDFLSQTTINFILVILYFIFFNFILKNQKITSNDYIFLALCLLINNIIPFITILQIYTLAS